MNRNFSRLTNLICATLLCLVLSSCSSSAVKIAENSPWDSIQIENQANALDVDFIDDNHGFLIGSNRLILETIDGGINWEEEIFKLIK